MVTNIGAYRNVELKRSRCIHDFRYTQGKTGLAETEYELGDTYFMQFKIYNGDYTSHMGKQ